MEGTKYGQIFLVCMVLGVVLLIPSRGMSSIPLYYGMKGLLVEQEILKGEIEYKRARLLRELDEMHRIAEHDRQMQKLRLLRPPTPEEGY